MVNTNIITGQRTYFLGLSSINTSQQTINIPFRDTSGNFIKCNYFKVSVTNSNQASLNTNLVAELSGVGVAGTLASNGITTISKFFNFDTGNVAGLTGSGICGVGTVFGSGDNGHLEWHGKNGDVCTGIRLRYEGNINNATYVIGVTYGNLLPYNTIRSSFYDVGV